MLIVMAESLFLYQLKPLERRIPLACGWSCFPRHVNVSNMTYDCKLCRLPTPPHFSTFLGNISCWDKKADGKVQCTQHGQWIWTLQLMWTLLIFTMYSAASLQKSLRSTYSSWQRKTFINCTNQQMHFNFMMYFYSQYVHQHVLGIFQVMFLIKEYNCS